MRIRKLRSTTAIVIIILLAGIVGLAYARQFIFKPPAKESGMKPSIVVAMTAGAQR